MKETNTNKFVIPEKIEIASKSIGNIAISILAIRLLCNAFLPRIIIIEKRL